MDYEVERIKDGVCLGYQLLFDEFNAIELAQR